MTEADRNEPAPCAECQKPSTHSTDGIRLCCAHYVARGGAPADWHPGCVRAASIEHEAVAEEVYQKSYDEGRRRASRLDNLNVWIRTQPGGCYLELDGEVGFGRPCVGILWKTHYIDTPGSGHNDHGPFMGSDSIGGPPEHVNAYHKHDCLAVLGTHGESIDGLLDWVDKIRAAGGNIVVKDRESVPGTDSPINWLFHGHQHAVIEFPEGTDDAS